MRPVLALMIGFTAGLISHQMFWTRSHSFLIFFLDQGTQSKDSKPSDSLSALQLPQEQWRHLVNEFPTVMNASNYRKGSFGKTKGCGFSSKLRLGPATNASRTLNMFGKGLDVHFKTAHCRNWSHVDSESHLREIKAGYLDRILRTNVVPPTVGYKMSYHAYQAALANIDSQQLLQSYMVCLSQNNTRTSETLTGSVMMYLDKVEQINVTILQDQASAYPGGSRNRTSTSAMNYIAFVYLAGCLKSNDNHFILQRQGHFVAVDNDRCFATATTFNSANATDVYHFGRLEQVLFQSCTFPAPLATAIYQAYGTDNSGRLLSQQLRDALRNDVLADELLALQPETMDEIDVRGRKFWKQIQKCRAQSERW